MTGFSVLRFGPGRVLRAAALAAIAMSLLAASPGHAASPAAAAGESWIEEILVEGVEGKIRRQVLAAAGLRRGRAYAEHEIAAALERIERLPGVATADAALARGSRRGLYRLRLQIDETRRFAVGGELIYSRFDGEVALDTRTPRDAITRFAPIAGRRFFFGTRGEAFAGAAPGEAVQLAYTHRGDAVTLRVGYARYFCCAAQVPSLGLDPSFASWRAGGDGDGLTLGVDVPLGGHHRFRLDAAWRQDMGGTRRPVLAGSEPTVDYDDLLTRRLAVGWAWDATDDPLLPTHGAALGARLELRDLRAVLTAADGSAAARASTSTQLRLALSGERHVSLGRRHSLSLRGRVAGGSASVDGLSSGADAATEHDLFEAGAELRHAVQLRRPGRRAAGELRWETWASWGWAEVGGGGLDDRALRRLAIGGGVAWRHDWGLVRIGLQLVDLDWYTEGQLS